MGKFSDKQATVTRIGLDLAKNVFQVHGVDAEGNVVMTRKLRRGAVLEFFRKLPPSLVFMETCASAHHWGREILALGHDVKLIPAAHVKPYVRRSKTDAADAAAICEASQRPNQRFVAVRSLENQAELMRHRTRELLVGQRTASALARPTPYADLPPGGRPVCAGSGYEHGETLRRKAGTDTKLPTP